MKVPDFIKNAKSGDIIATKYDDLIMVEHVEIKDKKVKIYYYFNYCSGKIIMNEWLMGFYGPMMTEDFYRETTDNEKKLFTSKLYDFGYVLVDENDKKVPRMTCEEYNRRYRNRAYDVKNANILNIVKGNWYVCIKKYVGIEEGTLCYSHKDNALFASGNADTSYYVDKDDASTYFRVATDDDKLPKDEFNIGDTIEFAGKELKIHDISNMHQYYKLIDGNGDVSIVSCKKVDKNGHLLSKANNKDNI